MENKAPIRPEEEEEEVEEYVYETDSEEEHTGMAMLKPVFVPESERDTIAKRERLEAEERALQDLMKRRLEERKLETKQIVAEEIRKSEYETDSEEEQTGIMVKPVFVPESERDTIAERKRLEAEERALQDLVKRRLEERKVETKQIVAEKIRKDKEIQKKLEVEANTADEVNEAEEYCFSDP